MTKKEKIAEEAIEAPAKPFEKGEEVWFCPSNGEKEIAVILDLPKEGSSKYLCGLKSGPTPINACYLSRE